MKKDIVLICTVGGSHQPIVTALRELKPGHTEFLCSDKDPGTGQLGSIRYITQKGNVIKSDFKLKAPDLPNIPSQVGLEEEQFGTTIIPSDELDAAFWIIRKKLLDLSKRFPDAAFVADYTGGTKTMTAALVTAVLETDGVALQLVTGNRPDLVKVKDGTQVVISTGIDTLKHQKAMRPFLAAWCRYAYDEAAMGLDTIPPPKHPEQRAEYLRLRDLSRAFAAWDRFDHGCALDLLEIYAPSAGTFLGPYLATLRLLCQNGPKQEPSRILDLWRNAQRRASQGRFDDAMGRCYRLIEWTAHWILKKAFDVDSSTIPADFIPPAITIIPTKEGKYQAGLMNAWELIRLKHDGPAGRFIQAEKLHLLDRVKSRNSSILAHGSSPLDEATWSRMAEWMETHFLPMLLEEASAIGIRKIPSQLPDDSTPLKAEGW